MTPPRAKTFRCPVCGQFGAKGPYHKWGAGKSGTRSSETYYRHGTKKEGIRDCHIKRAAPPTDDDRPDFERLKEMVKARRKE